MEVVGVAVSDVEGEAVPGRRVAASGAVGSPVQAAVEIIRAAASRKRLVFISGSSCTGECLQGLLGSKIMRRGVFDYALFAS